MVDGMHDLVENLRRHVERLAGLIGPRHVGRPRTLEAATTLIEREWQDAGYDVARHWYRASGVEVANLVAEIPGSDPAGGIVVLGAHYDTIPETPGADDNASAVAVLLEAARLLRPFTPRATIRFVAFPCEEPPHFHGDEMGSQVYARSCRERNEPIVGMLCLEMVGFYSKAAGSQQLPATIPRIFRPLFPRRGDFLAAVGNLRSWRLAWQFRRGFKKAISFPLFSIVLPELVREIRLSDNSSFWDQGYPALMLTDTSFLRNPHYHQGSDLPETLDYEAMAQVTLGVVGGVQHVAGGA